MCNFTHLDFVFPSLFFYSLQRIPRPKLYRPIVCRLNDLILGRIKGNTILTLPSALFNLIVCLPIGLLKLLLSVIETCFQIHRINFSFSQKINNFQKEVSFEILSTPL